VGARSRKTRARYRIESVAKNPTKPRLIRVQDCNPVIDPTGPYGGKYRVIRGGSWHFDARSVRAAYRGRSWPGYRIGYLGFRCALL
jgi:formylglycine-generating enzyme required for sulfatase activity